MYLLSENDIDRVVRHRRAYLAIGCVLMAAAVALPQGAKFGALSGFAVLGFGIYAFAFRRWRTDPGLWMLGVLLTVLLWPCYAYFTYLRWANVFAIQPGNAPIQQPASWTKVLASGDLGIAFVYFWRQVRLAFSIAVHNWRCTRRECAERPGG